MSQQYPKIKEVRVQFDFDFVKDLKNKKKKYTWKDKRKLNSQKRAIERAIEKLNYLLSLVENCLRVCDNHYR